MSKHLPQTSPQLPGKTLAPQYGQLPIGRVIERLSRAKSICAIALATTVNATDDSIAALATERSVPCFRGSEDYVPARFLDAALMMQAKWSYVSPPTASSLKYSTN